MTKQNKHQRELVKLDNRSKIIELTRRGKDVNDIAEELGMNAKIVQQHINDELDAVKHKLEHDATLLLAKPYGVSMSMLETLYNRFMEMVESGGDIDLGLVDRINRIIDTQTKLITRAQPFRVEVKGGIQHMHSVFTHDSKDYELAKQIAEDDPDIIEGAAIEFKQLVAGESDYDVDISDTGLYEKLYLEDAEISSS